MNDITELHFIKQQLGNTTPYAVEFYQPGVLFCYSFGEQNFFSSMDG